MEPRNLNSENESSKHLVVEFESSLPQSELNTILAQIELMTLEQNGGTFIATFPESVSINNFLHVVINNNVPLGYMRNISNSTRRFFVG